MILRFFHNMLRNKVTRHSGAISIQHSRLSTCFEIKSPDTRGLYRYSIVAHIFSLKPKSLDTRAMIRKRHAYTYTCFDKNSLETRVMKSIQHMHFCEVYPQSIISNTNHTSTKHCVLVHEVASWFRRLRNRRSSRLILPRQHNELKAQSCYPLPWVICEDP